MLVEPAEKDIMERQPRPVNENVVTWLMGLIVILQGLSMSLLSFGVFYLSMRTPSWGEETLIKQQSLTFAALVSMQLFQSFLSKSILNSIFHTGILNNKWMILAFFISFGFLVLGIYCPGINNWLEFEPIGGIGWVVVFIATAIHLVFVELMKWCIRSILQKKKN
jgi:Ca2+-transporting ATPase